VIFAFNDNDQEEYCTAIISLMQKDTRERTVKGEQVPDGIGFVVFKVGIRITQSPNLVRSLLLFPNCWCLEFL
jgi:hypothetical protein